MPRPNPPESLPALLAQIPTEDLRAMVADLKADTSAPERLARFVCGVIERQLRRELARRGGG